MGDAVRPAGRHQHRVRHAQRRTNAAVLNPAFGRRPSAVSWSRRQRRHRRRLWSSGTGRRVRGIMCRSWPIATDTWWRCRSPTLAAGPRSSWRDRSGAVRDEWCSLAVGPLPPAPTLPPDVSLRQRSGAGSLGRGRYFSRLRCGTGVTSTSPGLTPSLWRWIPPSGRTGKVQPSTFRMAGTAPEPGPLTRCPMPGRLRTVLRDGAPRQWRRLR